MDVPITANAAILISLMEGPGYQAELVKRVEQNSHGALQLGQGSVVPSLRTLVKRGWAMERPNGARDDRGRERKQYELTELGRDEAARIVRVLAV